MYSNGLQWSDVPGVKSNPPSSTKWPTTSHLKQLNTLMAGHGFGHTQKCGRVKPVH